MWVTFNDPGLTSLAGYGYGSFPPGNVGIESLGVDVYQVGFFTFRKIVVKWMQIVQGNHYINAR